MFKILGTGAAGAVRKTGPEIVCPLCAKDVCRSSHVTGASQRVKHISCAFDPPSADCWV